MIDAEAAALRPFSLDGERALHRARIEAARLNEPRIGPEFLAYALAVESSVGAAALLARLGADAGQQWMRLTRLREQKQRRPAPPSGHPRWTPPGFTADMRRVVRNAQELAGQLGHDAVRSEHLLLALLVDEEGRGAWRVSLLRVKPDDAWNAALDALGVSSELHPQRPQPQETPRVWVHQVDLRAVLPVAQSQTSGPHTLLLLSIESYADGFVLRSRFSTTQKPPPLPEDDPHGRPQGSTTHAHFVWEARDDLGHQYAPDDSGGSGGGSSWGQGWRELYFQGFTPALAAESKLLRLRVPELRWSNWLFAAPPRMK